MDEPAATGNAARPPGRRGGLRALLTASASVTAATVAVNLLSYLLVAVGTRALGPQRYGELAALLGLLLAGAIPATTLQVVLARRVAAGEAGGLGRAALRTALVVTAVGAAALPVLHLTLRISVPSLVLLVVTVPAMTVVGAPMGATQGLHLFGRLAVLTTIAGAGRIGGGLAGVAAGGTAYAAMVGMAIGAWLAVLGSVAVARGATWRALAGSRAPGAAAELARAIVTMLGLATLMTADVLLANRYLPAEEAGLYGAGAVVTKVTLWLPYAVTMIALPRLAVATHRRDALRTSVLVLAGLGVAEVGGVLLLGPVLFPLAVGDEYRPVTGWLWLFAAQGAMLAITQLAVVSRIAATDRLVGALLWTGVLVEVVAIAFLHGSIGTILTIAAGTSTAVTAAALLLPIRAGTGAVLPVGSLAP